jgi:glycosyltransferase involved in cell wall biosynthesis
LQALDADPTIEVVADPDDLRPWLWRATVFACPMVDGTGSKHKLLEAMAAGVPAVATPLACRGLGVVHGEHVLSGSSDEELAAQVVRLIRDEALRDRLSTSARRYVEDHHAPEVIAARHVALYAQVVAAKRPPAAP